MARVTEFKSNTSLKIRHLVVIIVPLAISSVFAVFRAHRTFSHQPVQTFFYVDYVFAREEKRNEKK